MMVWEADICVWIPSVPFGGSETIMGNSEKISGFQILHLRNGNSLPYSMAGAQGMMSGIESCSKTSISCLLWVYSSILGSRTSLGLQLNIWLLSLHLAELENVDCHLLIWQVEGWRHGPQLEQLGQKLNLEPENTFTSKFCLRDFNPNFLAPGTRFLLLRKGSSITAILWRESPLTKHLEEAPYEIILWMI